MKKTTVLKSWSKHNIPSDLWPELLSRLPVKSLLRFRCVSKSWRSFIDDPSFCRMHHTNSKTNLDETHLFVVQRPKNKVDKNCLVRASYSFKTTTSLGSFDTGRLGNNWSVVCLVDGLFMLQYDTPTLELLLWNPSIRRVRALPPSPVIPEGMKNVDLGFGFDPVINDYKHVRLVHSGKRSLHSIAIYTFGTGSWKTIEFQGKGISDWRWKFSYEESGMKFERGRLSNFRARDEEPGLKTVCFRGVLYFIAASNRGENLVSFDLSHELFASNSLPSENCWIQDEYANKVVTLVDGGSSLGLVYVFSDRGFVWVLENLDEWKQSDYMHWTKHFLHLDCIDYFVDYDPDEWKESNILYLKKNGDLILQWFSREVAAHNFKTGEEMVLLVNNSKLVLSMICGYIESLVLLNG